MLGRRTPTQEHSEVTLRQAVSNVPVDVFLKLLQKDTFHQNEDVNLTERERWGPENP